MERTAPFRLPFQLGTSLLLALYFTIGLYYFDAFTGGSMSPIAWNATVFGLLFGLGNLLLYLFRKKLPFKQNGGLALGKWAVLLSLTFLLTGFFLYLVAVLVLGESWSFESLLHIYEKVALVSLFPSMVALMLLQNRKPIPSANEDEQVIPPAPSVSGTNEIFRLESKSGESPFEIPLRELIFVEAADNYCKIYHGKEGNIRTNMFRTRIKDIEDILQGNDFFFRCHRSFLVNGHMVLSIKGNSQAYRLEMPYGLEEVRVSRSFDLDPIRKLIRNLD